MRDNFNHKCSVTYLQDKALRNVRVCGSLKETWWHENLDQQTSFCDGSGASNVRQFLSVLLKRLPEIAAGCSVVLTV